MTEGDNAELGRVARISQVALAARGGDYINRFKPAKTGTCFISVTCARSIFGA